MVSSQEKAADQIPQEGRPQDLRQDFEIRIAQRVRSLLIRRDGVNDMLPDKPTGAAPIPRQEEAAKIVQQRPELRALKVDRGGPGRGKEDVEEAEIPMQNALPRLSKTLRLEALLEEIKLFQDPVHHAEKQRIGLCQL